MRVLVNGVALTGTKTGVGHYLAEVTRALSGRRDLSLTVHQPSWIRRARAWLPRRESAVATTAPAAAPKKPSALKSSLVGLAYEAGQMLHRFEFRRLAKSGGFDLYHEPNFLPVECDLPTVVTVHDLSVVLHPEWHPADRVERHQREFLRGVSRSRGVVTVSETVRQEIIRTLGLPADRVWRTYNGVRENLSPMDADTVRDRRRALGLPEQFLLYIGTIEPRKNILRLLKAYVALPLKVRLAFPLVLVGSWGWNSADIREYLHDTARHKGVQYRGYVSEDDLCVLYNAARALVFPSHYEGFGLPPAEMLACGGAVLASTAGAVAEVVGRKACLTPAEDTDGWRDAMERVCTDHDWWRSLRDGAADAVASFTWARCAAETLAVYERIAGSGATRARAA